MSSTSTGTGVSGGDEVAIKIRSMQLAYLPKLRILLGEVQEILDQDKTNYLLQCKPNYLLQYRSDITRLQSNLLIPPDQYNRYNMDTLLALEQQIHGFVGSPKLSAALAQKVQVAHVNQGSSSVYSSFMLPPPTPIPGSQSASWAMHRRDNSSVDNSVYTNPGYHPKQDPPPINSQDGLNTSSHGAASSIIGVATGTLDYSGFALPPPTPIPGSQSASWAMHRTDNSSVDNSVYTNPGYHPKQDPPINSQDGLNTSSHGAASSIIGVATGTQDNSGFASYSNSNDQPYTPQVGGPQNPGSPYRPLASFQNSGSYQTSGGLGSNAYDTQITQANLWNDGSYANYSSHHNSDYTPANSSSAQSSGTVAPTDEHFKQQGADYYSQTPSGVICAPGTENKSTTSASTHDSQTTLSFKLNHPLVPSRIAGILSRSLASHTQPSPGTTPWQPQVDSSGTTSWNPPRSSSGMASWRPESISSAFTSWKKEPTSWKPEPTPSSTTSWRPESISSAFTSWKKETTSWKPEPTPSSTTSWRPESISSAFTSWKKEPTSWKPEPTPSSTTSWRPESISSAFTSWKKEPTSWKPEPTPSSTTSWRPESISSAFTSWKKEPTSWKPEPTPSSTTSWRPEPTPSWKPVPPPTSWKPDPPPSSSISWGQGPTSTSTMSWRPELTSSGLLTVQGSNAGFQNHPVSHPPQFQNPLDSNPAHYGNSHGLQQTACSPPGPTSHFPATNPGGQTFTSLLQSGSSMDTRQANTLQIAADPSILHILDDDQVEKEASSTHDHKRRKPGG